MDSKTKQEAIREKMNLIEEKTGDNVIIVTMDEHCHSHFPIYIDWPNWHDKTKLPKILYKTSVDEVHILHELVHLEKFFIQQYGIIIHEQESLSKIDIVFKNLPEDYVAHKVINYEYGFEPIDRAWFKNKDNLQLPSNEEIAANLVNFWAFSDFCPEYKNKLKSFSRKCRSQKPLASHKADKAIKALKEMDHQRRDSYNHCAEEIIKIFAPNYYDKQQIHLAYLSKIEGRWQWNSL